MENIKSVLFVIDTMQTVGGAQKVLPIFAHTLQKNGIKVKIFVLKKTSDDLRFDDLELIYCIDEHKKLTSEFFYIMTNLSLEAKKHDLLIGFMDFVTNFLTSLVASINKKPYMLSVRCEVSHAVNLLEFPEITKELVTLTYSNAQMVICNSEASRQDVISNYEVKSEKTFLLKNPLDLEHIALAAKEPLGADEEALFGRKTIVAVGRLSFQKNYKILFEAFRILLDGYDKNINLVVLGDGEGKAELERLIDEKNLRNNAFLIGNKKNIYKYLSRADIFVHAAISEGSPNAVMEAMAIGMPIVASNIGSISEMLVDGKSAILFDPNDAGKIADSLKLLLSDSGAAKKLSINASDEANKFSIENFDMRVLGILKNTINK